jgi:copper(I)-binding protein
MNHARALPALLLAAMLPLLSACGAAAEAGGDITVSDARIPVPAGANGAMYLTLTNGAGADDALIGASTDIAAVVELHESSIVDGTMTMSRLDRIDLPADGRAVLEPGGLHMMLIDVTGDLAEGDEVDVSLTFENAGERSVTATVVPIVDAGGMQMGSEHSGMHRGSEAPSGS